MEEKAISKNIITRELLEWIGYRYIPWNSPENVCEYIVEGKTVKGKKNQTGVWIHNYMSNPMVYGYKSFNTLPLKTDIYTWDWYNRIWIFYLKCLGQYKLHVGEKQFEKELNDGKFKLRNDFALKYFELEKEQEITVSQPFSISQVILKQNKVLEILMFDLYKSIMYIKPYKHLFEIKETFTEEDVKKLFKNINSIFNDTAKI